MTPSLPGSHAARPARILVVEDEAIVALELTERLNEAGYIVCGTADSADEAVETARVQRPDLILMDVVLKGPGDGIGAAHRIAGFASIPVVYLTSFSDAATIQRAAATGPYGYLTKPYQQSELIAAIEVACYKSLLEQRLKVSERWFSSTLRCVGDAVLTVGLDHRVRFANPAAERLIGRSARSMVGAPLAAVLDFEDGAVLPGAGAHDAAVHVNRRLRTGAGVVSVDESTAPIRDERGTPLGFVCALRDVTDRVEAERAVRSSEERFRTAFEFAPIGMALVAMDGTLIQTNSALRALLAVDAAADALADAPGATGARAAPRLHDFLSPEDADDEAARLRALAVDRQRPFTHYERRFRAADGRVFWGSVSASVMHGPNAPAWFFYQVLDITERKAEEGRPSDQAHCDGLTGLANRARFVDELRRLGERTAEAGGIFAVAVADLDAFTSIGTAHGHAVADELLVLVAKRLRAVLRTSDCIARWGGDEFAFLLDGLPSAREAATVADKIVSAFAEPFHTSVGEVRIGLSLGLAVCPDDADTPDELLSLADAALYRCKHGAKGSFRLQDDFELALERASQPDYPGLASPPPPRLPAPIPQGEVPHD